ncbi:MAG: class I SAM-dependent methyltransferase [Chloroflexota bacterium]
MAEQAEGYSFTKFASLDFYGRVNAQTLDLAEIGKQRRIVDLSCGTGAITRLILERLDDARSTVIYAIDHSSEALRLARQYIGDRTEAVVKFVQAEVENLSDVLGEQVDSVVYLNAIHYVQDKRSLIRQIREALGPDGVFVFNSGFFDGAHTRETDNFARRWMMRSLRILNKEYGLRPQKSEKTEARQQLTPDDYRQLLEDEGFEVSKQHIQHIDVPIDGWYDISGFQDFIEGVMPGVPLDKASDSLQRGCKETWDEMGLETVPRNWLLVVATKKQ